VNYNEMMRLVVGRTGLTRRQADRAVVGTLTVLSEAISAKETKDLLAQLPKSLRDRVPVTSEVITMRPIEFIARVGELTEVTSSDAAEASVRAVFATFGEAVNAGEMNDIAEELGDEFAELLGRHVRARRAADTSADRGVARLLGELVVAASAFPGRVFSLACRPLVAGIRLAASRSE